MEFSYSTQSTLLVDAEFFRINGKHEFFSWVVGTHTTHPSILQEQLLKTCVGFGFTVIRKSVVMGAGGSTSYIMKDFSDNCLTFSVGQSYSYFRILSTENEYTELTKAIEALFEQPEKPKTINMLISGANGGLMLKAVGVDFEATDDLILTHYNDDFQNVHKTILESLDSDSTGLILLHGDPGTGKTTYIRYLLGAVNKKVIYLPPDMAFNISGPAFLTFMMDNTDSILVIEDAENVLKERAAGDGQSVANLLNLTDGLLGDVLKCKVICTFNCHEDHIDPALKRKGRLISKYKFGKLEADKASALLAILGHGSTETPMTLADIYQYGIDNGGEKPERKFGFSK